MHQTRFIWHAWLIIGAAACAGCGSGSSPDLIPIRGEVVYRGKPLGDGQVIYLPAEPGAGRQASGQIQADGSFQLTTREPNDGVFKGNYKIAIYAYEPHPGEPQSREEYEELAQKGGIKRGYLIPARYADSATSELTDKVDEQHSGFKRIELSD